MTDSNPAQPQHAASPDARTRESPIASTQRRVSRRRLVKAATVTVAGVAAASGYVRPSVRPLQIPIAHAFSF